MERALTENSVGVLNLLTEWVNLSRKKPFVQHECLFGKRKHHKTIEKNLV